MIKRRKKEKKEQKKVEGFRYRCQRYSLIKRCFEQIKARNFYKLLKLLNLNQAVGNKFAKANYRMIITTS